MKKLLAFIGNRMLLLFGLMFLTSLCFSQQVVSGTITDSNGEPVIGATVVGQGTSTGTITDLDGSFEITVPESVEVLEVSYTGYKTQTLPIAGTNFSSIQLQTDTEILDEVVVVGYGRQKKSVVTGAVSSVDLDQIATRSAGTLESAMQGQAAGITITPNSGAPDAGFKVKIRGTGSNGPSDPLYIVDGMRTRDISFLESSAIASLEVLKDAASAAIYGAEGANGVVLITTKNGTKNTGISYNVQYGSQSYRGNMELMDGPAYLSFLNEANPTGNFEGQGSNTDWLDEIFETAPLSRHNLSFSGGDEKLSYHVGGTYFNQAGILGGKDKSKFQRISGNLGVASKINDKLKVGVNLTYANKQTTGSGIFGDQRVGGIISSAILMDPTTPVVYDQAAGEIAIQNNADNGVLTTDEDGNVYGISNIVGGEIINPFVYLDQINGDGRNENTLFASAYGTYSILDNLEFTSRVGLETTNGTFHNWSRAYYYSPERFADAPSSVFNKFDGQSVQWENFISYDVPLGSDMELTLLAGQSIYQNNSSFLNAFAGGLAFPANEVSYVGGSEADNDVVGGNLDQRLLSYFGRANFQYADKYLLSASLRRDGTSLFADGNRFKTYPGVSVGWVISREDFFGDSGPINFLKLRGSWGQVGSLSGVMPGAGQPNVGFLYRYSDAAGGFITIGETTELANPDLTWETGEQTNIGLDFGFFEDRFTLSVDWFNKLTRDLIAQSSAPVFIGNSAPLVNAGTMSNRGLEFEAAYKNRDNALKYQVAVNVTTLKNEVTEINGGLGAIPGSFEAQVGTSWTPTVFEQGQPAWYFRGYKTEGIDENGEIIFANVDGDEMGIINEEDQTYIGDPHPNLLYGGALNLEYGNFDFTLFVQGQAGNDILVGYLREDRGTQNRPTFFNDSDFPNPSTSAGNLLRSDKMIFDGSYTRIKQIQVGYNFGSLLKGTRGLRIYGSLEDYFTFTKYPGLDPEIGSSFNDAGGIDRGVYPIPGRILIGASLNF